MLWSGKVHCSLSEEQSRHRRIAPVIVLSICFIDRERLGLIFDSSFRAFARISYHFFNVSLASVFLWSSSGHHGRWRRRSGSYAEEGKSWRTSRAQSSKVLLLRQLLTPDLVSFEFKNPVSHYLRPTLLFRQNFENQSACSMLNIRLYQMFILHCF